MKNRIFNTIALTAAMAIGIGSVSCSDYLDINDNPNSPTVEKLDAGMILPGAELTFANQYGTRLRILSGYYAQYYSQLPGTSNYLSLSAFSIAPSLTSSIYTYLNEYALNNLEIVRTLAEADDDWGSYLAATVLRVSSYQALVDCYGATPYSEALDITNPQPNYDEGKDIYPKLVAELDDALAKVNAGDDVCTNFLFKNEKAANWIKLANAVKLRLLMRMCNVVDVRSQLASLIAEDNFPTSDVAWTNCWSDQAGNTNPFYYEEFYPGRQNNISLNVALQNTYESAQDAREQALWTANDDGEYQGWVSTATGITAQSDYFNQSDYSRPAIEYDSPVYYITLAEIEFFKAEYEARYGSATNAQAHYEAAVKASFTEIGLSESDAQLVLDTYPYDSSNYKQCIGIQKWVHLAGTNPFEGYCELRRLGYPTFSSVQGTDIYNMPTDEFDQNILPGGYLYTPIQVSSNVGANQLLERWPFPESSTKANSNVPTFAGYTTKIFWAQ